MEELPLQQSTNLGPEWFVTEIHGPGGTPVVMVGSW